jgi:hypothetical protein
MPLSEIYKDPFRIFYLILCEIARNSVSYVKNLVPRTCNHPNNSPNIKFDKLSSALATATPLIPDAANSTPATENTAAAVQPEYSQTDY